MLAGKAFGVKMHRVQGTVKQVEGPGSPGALSPPSKELVQQYGADPQMSHGDGFNRCGPRRSNIDIAAMGERPASTTSSPVISCCGPPWPAVTEQLEVDDQLPQRAYDCYLLPYLTRFEVVYGIRPIQRWLTDNEVGVPERTDRENDIIQDAHMSHLRTSTRVATYWPLVRYPMSITEDAALRDGRGDLPRVDGR